MSGKNNVTESEHSRRVREMFAGIASRYDFLNHILSANTDTRWRRLVARKLQPALEAAGMRVLDVACGTGDFCRPMLEIAVRKAATGARSVPFVEGDALSLPFADDSFDAVSIAFGLRNLSSVKRGLKELRRVLKPGGRAAILEFSRPIVPGFRSLFQFYFRRVLPRIGGMVSGSRGAYEYLPDSVSRFPDQKCLAAMMAEVGFTEVEYQNLTGGIAALHLGTRPRL